MGFNRKKQLGMRIRALRKQAGLKQEEVADSVGIDSKSLSRIEQGKHYPSLETLEAIGQAVGAQMRDFFEFAEDQENMEEVRKRLREYVESLPDNYVRDLLRKAKEFDLSLSKDRKR